MRNGARSDTCIGVCVVMSLVVCVVVFAVVCLLRDKRYHLDFKNLLVVSPRILKVVVPPSGTVAAAKTPKFSEIL